MTPSKAERSNAQTAGHILGSIKPKDLEGHLKKRFEHVRHCVETKSEERLLPILLRGSPGIGKSDIIRMAAKKADFSFVDIRLAQMEPVDVRGFPFVVNGQMVWLAPTGAQDMMKSDFGVFVLEEMASAPPAVQVPIYQMVLDHRIGDLQIKPGWFFIATGNKATDKAIVSPLSSALVSRFKHMELTCSFENWRPWAIKNGVAEEVLGYLERQTDQLFEEPRRETPYTCPRSWTKLSMELKAYGEDFQCRDAEAIVGPRAITWWAYKDVYKSLTCAKDIAEGNSVEVPKEPDRFYALISCLRSYYRENPKKYAPGLLNYLAHLAEKEQKDLKNYGATLLQDMYLINPGAIVHKDHLDLYKKVSALYAAVGGVGMGYK